MTQDTFTASRNSPLPIRFVIYLPGSAEGDGAGIATAVKQMLCDRFGGVTSYPAVGVFKRVSGTNLEESVQVLESFCEKARWEQEEAFVHSLVEVIATLLDQESVACLVEGRMCFVAPLGADESFGLGGSGEELSSIVERRLLNRQKGRRSS